MDAKGTPITDNHAELAWCEFARKREERAWPGPIELRDQGLSIASFKAGAEWQRAACAELARAAGCLCDFLADGDARWADCGSCQGRGYAPPSPSVACALCHGQGTVVENHDHRCPAAILAAIEDRGRG